MKKNTRLCITVPGIYNCSLEVSKFGVSYFYIDGSENMKQFGAKLIELGVQAIHDARDVEK